MKQILAIITTALFFQTALAQDLSVFEKKQFIRGKDTLRYRMLYPEKYKKRKAYPLVVFLHGSGERGNDNEAQLMHGGKLFADPRVRSGFPAIVIFPQCPKDSAWARYKRLPDSNEREFTTGENPTVPQKMVKMLIDSLSEAKAVNNRKIYLGGLSLGGFGTYDLLTRYPDYFAAAFPICGGANIPAYLEQSMHVPLWIFHGGIDNVVTPKYDRDLYKALMTRGIKTVTYTEYPHAGHNSWDSAFAEPKLLPWLFSNKKKKA